MLFIFLEVFYISITSILLSSWNQIIVSFETDSEVCDGSN